MRHTLTCMPFFDLNHKNKKMRIIQATLDYLPALAPIFDAYRVFYRKESDTTAALQFLLERLDQQDSVIFISLTDDGNINGFVQLYPLFSSTRMKKLWMLNDLFVLPEYRGQGISKALIEAAKNLATQTDSCGLLLETEKSNAVANALYLNTDFTIDNDHNYYSWDVS